MSCADLRVDWLRFFANSVTMLLVGTKKGKLLKQGSSLARFNEWFGSMSLMNTLSVWFPTHKIQKWNVISRRVHPILVANARVDWLALQDTELTQNFPILREGILHVFSQRASSAWQGAQPQRVTVSLLLPGSGTADQ